MFIILVKYNTISQFDKIGRIEKPLIPLQKQKSYIGIRPDDCIKNILLFNGGFKILLGDLSDFGTNIIV
jgi:hypothetical protein